MTSKRIKELAPLIPPQASYLKDLPTTKFLGLDIPEINLLSYCLSDIAFGWNFVRSFVETRQPLPPEAHEPSLIRAYQHLRGFRDESVIDSILIMMPRAYVVKVGMDLHLLEKELPIPKISEMLTIEPQVVTVYADLFFNIRQRAREELTLLNFVYPETRRVEMQPNYLMTESTAKIAHRLTYNWGVDVARKFTGFKENPLSSGDSMASTRTFESLIMSNGVYLSQLGGLNVRNAPGIGHSRAILSAIKQSGQEEMTDDSVRGLTAVSINFPVNDYIRKMTESGIRHRQALAQQEFEEQQRNKLLINSSATPTEAKPGVK